MTWSDVRESYAPGSLVHKLVVAIGELVRRRRIDDTSKNSANNGDRESNEKSEIQMKSKEMVANWKVEIRENNL
jgi:hypothetical protein